MANLISWHFEGPSKSSVGILSLTDKAAEEWGGLTKAQRLAIIFEEEYDEDDDDEDDDDEDDEDYEDDFCFSWDWCFPSRITMAAIKSVQKAKKE